MPPTWTGTGSWTGRSSPSGPADQIYVTGRLNRLLTQAEDDGDTLDDQELDTRTTTGVVYWEGAQLVAGTRDGAPVDLACLVSLAFLVLLSGKNGNTKQTQ